MSGRKSKRPVFHIEYRRKGTKKWRKYVPFQAYAPGLRAEPTSKAINRVKKLILKDETVYCRNGRVTVPKLEFRLARITETIKYREV